MYHHRYQPPTNLANKTTAFARHNYPTNSYPSSSALAATTTAATPTTTAITTKSSPSISRNYPSNNNIIHQTSNNHSGSSYSYAPTSRSAEDRQDVIFRKVRGILNKITPETFDKLSKELVNVGLDSPRTLRGVIYLLFDKALKDLKYSSLYAKLCQELSEKAPNFEVEPGPNTFCKFLISKCEDEFERRRKATENFDKKNDLTDEEYEQRAIAKKKMLGNIKFICELGKKRLLQEEILHECIRGLLSKKKERSIQDQAQDLECLCQIMRTIGSLLDIQASRNLMNQYFERIEMFSKKPELPSRIRFMLRDVIDLRNNNWRPRPFQREDNVPQPLSKLREEAGYDPAISSSIDKFGNSRNLIGMSDLSKLHGNKLSFLLDDEPSFTTSADFHWGPSFLTLDNPFDPFSVGSTTNKPVQNQNIASTNQIPAHKTQSSTQPPQNSSNFRMHDPFPEHGGSRRTDTRPGFTRHNIVNQQRPTNDFSRFKNGPLRENRQRINMLGPLDDVELPISSKSQQSGIATYSPAKIQRDDSANLDEPQRLSEPQSTQQSNRGLPLQQYNRPNARCPETKEPQFQEGNLSGQFPQSRSNNRHIESRNSMPVSYKTHGVRDRRSFHHNNHQEQNSRFPNTYRPAKPDRAHRSRENFQFERSNNESETNQNWRAGPPSSTSSVASKSSSNAPHNSNHTSPQRQSTRFSETGGQEKRVFVQPNLKSPAKETIKPQLNTSILPKPPKISNTDFSLRPSHNLINARGPVATSKSIIDDKDAVTSTAPQATSEVNKNQLQGGDSNSNQPNSSGSGKPVTNGSLSNNDAQNKSARDFHVNKFVSVLSEHSNEERYNMTLVVSKVKELKIPKNYQSDCLVSGIRQSIFKTESDRENMRKLLSQLVPSTFETVVLLNAFKTIFEHLQALEAEIPKVKSLVAGFLSQAILDGSSTLEDVGNVLSGGKHHPLFLLCLQKLENSAGQAWLSERFVNSKIDLMAMLPEVDRSKDRLASVLKDRCLGFLDPMLTIEPDLWEQMKDKDSSPTAIYRWIMDNVSATIQGTPTFAHVLVTCLVRYIHTTSTERIKSSDSEKSEETSLSNKSSPSSTSQGTADVEKELLFKYQQMLQAILKDKQMQLATLYSLQSFYHKLDFPKGALLRWFHQMYDLNVVDDDVFFIWKEEINDNFPGKGQALFQVNTWLNWLAETESDEEEEV